MTCPHCGRQHEGHERSEGAFSAVCERCFTEAANEANGKAPAKPAKEGRQNKTPAK